MTTPRVARRAAAVTVVGLLLPGVGTAWSAAPTPPEPALVHEQLVLADLDPAGLPTSVTYVSRIVARDLPEQEIDVPGPTTKVRYLDRPGSPDVVGEAVRVTVGGPGETSVATQATFGKPLPVALHAEYVADGAVVDPESVTGRSGRIQVRYTVTNTDVSEQEVTYRDARGRPTKETLPVFAPFAGAMSVDLPAGAQLVDAKGAVMSTTGDGRTRVTWNLVLYPPLGTYQQERVLTIDGSDLNVPGVRLEVVPVTRGQDPATGFAADLLDSSVTGNAELADGLGELDASATTLAAGAGDVTEGLLALQEGTAQLSAQVSGPLVSGATQLATGSAALATGQAELATGVTGAAGGAASLQAGLAKLGTGLDELSAGLAKLAAPDGLPAAQQAAASLASSVASLATVVGSASDPPLPDPPPESVTLVQAVRAAEKGTAGLGTATTALADSLAALAPRLGQVAVGATAAATAAGVAAGLTAGLSAQVCGPVPVLTPLQCAALSQATAAAGTARTTATAAAAGAAAAAAAVTLQEKGARGVTDGLAGLGAGLVKVETGLTGVGAALRSGSTTSPGVYEGLVSLSDGLTTSVTAVTSLSQGAASSATAADQLTTAAGDLATGLSKASSGADALAFNSRTLAAGAAQQAAGTTAVAGALADVDQGVAAAASGSEQVAEGASALQQDGTSDALGSVVSASTKPALAQAYLRAADARAPDAVPYGPAKGAVGRVAYVYDLVPPPADTGRNLALLGIAVLAVAALVALAFRRLRNAADRSGSGPPASVAPGDVDAPA